MITKEVQKYFKDLIVTRVKNYIAVELSKYSFNIFNQYLSDISDGVSKQVQKDIAEFGIKILQFI